jgi:hypothetical protein
MIESDDDELIAQQNLTTIKEYQQKLLQCHDEISFLRAEYEQCLLLRNDDALKIKYL